MEVTCSSWTEFSLVVVTLAAAESSPRDQKGHLQFSLYPWIRLRFYLQMNPSLWKRKVRKNMTGMYNPTEINFIKKNVNYTVATHREGPKRTLSIL